MVIATILGKQWVKHNLKVWISERRVSCCQMWSWPFQYMCLGWSHTQRGLAGPSVRHSIVHRVPMLYERAVYAAGTSHSLLLLLLLLLQLLPDQTLRDKLDEQKPCMTLHDLGLLICRKKQMRLPEVSCVLKPALVINHHSANTDYC